MTTGALEVTTLQLRFDQGSYAERGRPITTGALEVEEEEEEEEEKEELEDL